MEPRFKKESLKRVAPILSVILSVAVLGATVFLARLKLGNSIRDQIINRDAEVLYSAVCLLRDSSGEQIVNINDPADQLTLILRASNLRGVIAVRLFDSNGKFITALPVNVKEGILEEKDLNLLKTLKPGSHFYKELQLKDLFYYLPDSYAGKSDAQPVLVVNIPLHPKAETNLTAVAQFFIEGSGIAGEFAFLEKNLNIQALLAFGIGTILIVTGLGYAFYKLEQTTKDLRRANQELAMAARTSAIGAITAHLIHGLKSPLTGLELLASDKSAANGETKGLDSSQALQSIHRIKSMINEVVNLLREESAAIEYEITTDELRQMVENKTAALAKEKGVIFQIDSSAKADLSNRAASLVCLILTNLIENAIHATPPGKRVKLTISIKNGALVCEVSDEGCGLPEKVLKNLFMPCHSTKPGGSGIGLAISKHLANHLGASLKLKSSSSAGTSFELVVPIPSQKVIN
ncbi:MAG: sensor histidine kinase [Limisphaerales bacterium]